MSKAIVKKNKAAKLRAHRTRARLHGTETCPRMSVKRSLKHVYVQLINDDKGVTLVSASDKDASTKGKSVEVALEVGQIVGEKAMKAGITSVVFDRGSYKFHGRVAAIAEGARKAGLVF